jgi:phage-related protein
VRRKGRSGGIRQVWLGRDAERVLYGYARSGIVMHVDGPPKPKPVFWVGTCKEDLRAFPAETRQVMGYALYVSQLGGKHPDAKPLKGFGGAGVLEVVEDYDGNTYRAVYTVKLAGAVYALHAFQKKSKKGSKTTQADIEKIKSRLKVAQSGHAERLAKLKEKEKPGEDKK